MLRQPAVAYRFYPGSPKELERTVKSLLPDPDSDKINAIAAISPHAGYIYSGRLAGRTLGAAVIPETVVIIGPNHHGRGAPIAVSKTPWEMPCGTVPIAQDIVTGLLEASVLIRPDEAAHRDEHSLEVQVPFLQALQPHLSLVPIAVSRLDFQSCTEVANTLAEVIKTSAKPVLLVASTDMSHYESRSSAAKKDRRALDRIIELDPEGLYRTVTSEHITMCGFIPVTITMIAAKLLGASKVDLVDYTDSGDVSGDTSQVVGYAGLIIH